MLISVLLSWLCAQGQADDKLSLPSKRKIRQLPSQTFDGQVRWQPFWVNEVQGTEQRGRLAAAQTEPGWDRGTGSFNQRRSAEVDEQAMAGKGSRLPHTLACHRRKGRAAVHPCNEGLRVWVRKQCLFEAHLHHMVPCCWAGIPVL